MPKGWVRLHQCHHSSCIRLVRTRVWTLLLPVLGLERGFLGNKDLAVGEVRRASQPADNFCFCRQRVRSCSLGWNVLLLGPVCSSLSPSHFCHSPLPTFFFFIQGLFCLLGCSHSKTSGKGSQMEKRVIYFLSFPIFVCVCSF